MLTTLLTLAAPKALKMTTSNAANDDNQFRFSDMNNGS